MEIKASVTYSPVVAKANGKFTRYNSKDQKRKNLKTVAICLIISSVVMSLGLAFNNTLVILVGMLPVTYVFCIYVSYFVSEILTPFLQKPLAEKNKDLYVPTYYTFFDDFFRIERSMTASQMKQDVKYSELRRVLESKDFFWLEMETRGGTAVDKATFLGGSAEDLRSRISSYLGEKYILLDY